MFLYAVITKKLQKTFRHPPFSLENYTFVVYREYENMY